MAYKYTFELDCGNGCKKQHHKYCYHYKKTKLYARCKSLLDAKEIKSFKVFRTMYVKVDEQIASECEGVQQK